MNYVVVKKGVYQHGTWGPYSSVKQACDAARVLALADEDCYHEWVVHSISPDDGLSKTLGSVSKQCTPTSWRCNHSPSTLPE